MRRVTTSSNSRVTELQCRRCSNFQPQGRRSHKAIILYEPPRLHGRGLVRDSRSLQLPVVARSWRACRHGGDATREPCARHPSCLLATPLTLDVQRRSLPPSGVAGAWLEHRRLSTVTGAGHARSTLSRFSQGACLHTPVTASSPYTIHGLAGRCCDTHGEHRVNTSRWVRTPKSAGCPQILFRRLACRAAVAQHRCSSAAGGRAGTCCYAGARLRGRGVALTLWLAILRYCCTGPALFRDGCPVKLKGVTLGAWGTGMDVPSSSEGGPA